MVQQKASVFIISSSFLISLFYYNYYDRGTFRVDDVTSFQEPIYLYNGSETFLINTTGCKIPNYGNTFEFMEAKERKQTCGERAIFVQRIDNNHILFRIDTDKMIKYKRNNKYECCYKFAGRSKASGKEDTVLSYTPCKPFINGSKVELLQDVITVTCISPSKIKSNVIYKDAFIVIKKQTTYNREMFEENDQKMNVLLLGMDTMSRARIFSTMPKTVKYLQKYNWLDYKGYHKVGYNTFPNVMSILTGMNLSSIYSACRPNMYTCNELLIWSTFSKAGYITAYGEENLQLPDTFFNYNGFKSMPTHHYMRPLFLTGEHQRGNLICTGSLPSGKHVLDYAYDFADTYKNERFFGTFWINSYSHNLINKPSLFEKDVVDFFEKIQKSSIAHNTFILFLSDHGIRYGPTRVPMESYYEERLPMFFMWVPNEFKDEHEEEYNNLQLNQNRLVTPYDLYVTLMRISNVSVNSADITSTACPSCKSLFENISTHRTCAEAGVSEKWCSCHGMKSVDNNTDKDATSSLQLAVSHVQDKRNKIETVDNCNKCVLLQLDSVLRTHMFIDGNKTYYVVAFQMKPGQVIYEATVLKANNNLTILGGIDTLSGYNTRGNCVKKANDRMYCVCKKVKCYK